VHLKYIPTYIQQDATLHSLFISGNCSTYFRWKYHPKHVEEFPDRNKLCNVASCWIYTHIGILLGAHLILYISRIRVNSNVGLWPDREKQKVGKYLNLMKQQIKKKYRWRNNNPAMLSACATCNLGAQLLRSLEETPIDFGLVAMWSAEMFWFLQRKEKSLLLSGI
jgi:hypothetical protein